MPVGQEIARLRNERGLTQAELGEALGGHHQVTISNVETEKKPVLLVLIRHLALFFGVLDDTTLYTPLAPAAGQEEGLAKTG